MNIFNAGARLAAIVDTAHRGQEPTFLTRRGVRVAAVADAAEFERLLEAAEELEGIRAVDAASKFCQPLPGRCASFRPMRVA